MEHNQDDASNFLAEIGARLSGIETGVFKFLHLNPHIYFRMFPPRPTVSEKALVKAVEHYYEISVTWCFFWMPAWILFCVIKDRFGLLRFVKGFKTTAAVICVKVWLAGAGLSYIMCAPILEKTWPSFYMESFWLAMKVSAWCAITFVV